MIVVDTSVFIDALFEYKKDRTEIAKNFFRKIQEKNISIVEPDVFKIELIGQLVRRMPKEEAMTVYELIIENVEISETNKLKEVSFGIAFQTGCRAIDSFYIAISHSTNSLLVSNDKFQVESARKYGVKAFYLLEEFDQLERILNKSGDQSEPDNSPLGH
ncbi:type II toxin-antitoxin system VapC family toxin [Thermococcus aggregans]|uniref:Type II toxin-antitoxin system VapC family toxin n=1 Tax=Thermococcus aggregans TaxID=110163 RepID=A0A9E7MY47_THEAG|nr:type II toxin-antitoxin system VapC family toxin [Thermococcus aggregans]USS41028.1 type II toxin-antitoxin system VapC family toxin [Thermococcus aggregans]